VIRKFASAAILDAHIGGDAGFTKSAHRAVFDYTPREGYLYVRSRAISSRCNDNFDMFPAEEIEKSYLTFIGKPVFVNHHNEDHRRARGVIIDAALHKDRNPDGSPDTWAEVLMEVDAIRFPRLAKAILAGEVDRTSMGCDVQLSKCSVCGNEATSPLQYCAHIPGKKGKKIYKLDPVTGEKKAQLVFEICSGLSFFENSLLVEAPADPTAFFLGSVEVGPGLEHLTAGLNKTAALHPYAWNPEGRTEPFSFQEGAEFQRQNFQGNTMFDAKPLNVWALLKQASDTGDDLFDWDFIVQAAGGGLKSKRVSEMSEAELAQHHKNIEDGHKWASEHPVHPDHIVAAWHNLSDEHKQMGMNWYSDAQQHAKLVSHLTDTPLHQVAGLMAIYSPQMHWASNLHVATHVARTKEPIGGKGKKSQIPVRTEKGDYKNEGFMTSNHQREQAQQVLNGVNYNEAISPRGHKIRNFAHLIEHGGDEHSVVVDRHAYSVAAGSRITDNAFTHAISRTLSTAKGYKHVADAYREAAARISEHEGQTIHPHQVQAATWLGQQAKNAAEESQDIADIKAAKTSKVAQRHVEKWMRYAGEHFPEYPELHENAPGTGWRKDKAASRHVAYGETKSPEDVDTLRSENCTVCGNSSAWDGTQCQVCGYVAPPRPFGDPNTDIAQQKDIRKQVLDGTEADPNDPDQQLGQQQGDPEELQDQQEEAAAGMDPQLQTLTCNVCGTGIQPAAPTSESDGEPPYPAEGDVCPVCKKGQLLGDQDESVEDPEAEMDSEDAEEGQEGNAPGGASQQEAEEDDGDESADSKFKGKQDTSDDDDQDDGDSFDPKKKNPRQSSLWPSWFRPVWLQN
jgi:hypothetical protein